MIFGIAAFLLISGISFCVFCLLAPEIFDDDLLKEAEQRGFYEKRR